MATEPTEFTAPAKSEPNAQVAGEAKCPFDPRGRPTAPRPATSRSATRR